jgi:hypothetical protein
MASPANRRLGESGKIRSIPLGKRREISGEIAQQKRASVQEGKSARRTPLGRSDDSQLSETADAHKRRQQRVVAKASIEGANLGRTGFPGRQRRKNRVSDALKRTSYIFHSLFRTCSYWFGHSFLNINSSLSEVPRSYRGRNTNPDEHPKWLAVNELR